jgi:hypothetical protein
LELAFCWMSFPLRNEFGKFRKGNIETYFVEGRLARDEGRLARDEVTQANENDQDNTVPAIEKAAPTAESLSASLTIQATTMMLPKVSRLVKII